MLSVLDLIDAGTMDLDLAAMLMSLIARGASFMVGARPGGAGKTTMMAALLNLIPRERSLVAATAACVRGPLREGCCYICHEIGAGPYFAYLWGTELRAYCALTQRGAMLATNLHADDLDETRDQVCAENGVPLDHFNAFRVLVFLRVRGGYGRARHWVERVYMGNGATPQALVFEAESGIDTDAVQRAGIADPDWTARCRAFLAECHARPERSIEEVRTRVVRFLAEEP